MASSSAAWVRGAVQRERAGRHVEDVRSRNVGWHEVGGALHALESEAADARQRLDRKRFGEAGHAFDDGVSPAQENLKQLVGEIALANQDLRQFGMDVPAKGRNIFHGQ
jgi:hypothetical protein